ncbi:MAG: DUF222 domain-containing protein [Nocardioidaceae bacterium]
MPSAAKGSVELATALHTDALGIELAATRAALRYGRVRAAQAAAIAGVIADAPRSATAEVKTEAEARLLHEAKAFNAAELARLGTTIWELVDPDAADADEAERLRRQEERAFASRRLSLPRRGDGLTGVVGQLDDEGAMTLRTALSPLAKPLPRAAAGPDPRSYGQRMADALVELARRALAGGDLPDEGGERPQLVITMREQTLADGTGHAVGGNGTHLSAEAARWIGCDADHRSAVVAGRVPLHVSRRHRFFGGTLRMALVLRDGGCAFPGCDRPPAWCQAHHIVPWHHEGETSLANGVLLCGHHHRLVHTADWHCQMAADGHPEFLPPAWIDPGRRPLRNTVQHRLRT